MVLEEVKVNDANEVEAVAEGVEFSNKLLRIAMIYLSTRNYEQINIFSVVMRVHHLIQ